MREEPERDRQFSAPETAEDCIAGADSSRFFLRNVTLGNSGEYSCGVMYMADKFLTTTDFERPKIDVQVIFFS